MAKLTDKQRIFANEYLVDLNATRAYKKAYPSCKKEETAAQAGSRLLKNVKVRKYIDERMKAREIRTEITQDKVLKELAKIGFANINDYVSIVEKSYMKPIKDNEGNIIDEEEVFYKSVEIEETKNIDKDKLGAIAGIKQGQTGIEIKLSDKIKALENIGRHLGMFKDKVEIDANVNSTKKLDSILEQLGENLIQGNN